MEIKIYADVLFLTNLFMDYLLLYLSAKITKQKIIFWQIATAAFLGALLCSIIFFANLPSTVNTVVKIVLGIMMVYITFLPKRLLLFVKQSCIFFLITFCFGGICFSLFFFTDMASRVGAVFSGGILYFNFPVYKLLVSCLICYIILEISFLAVKKYKKHAAKLYDVDILKNEQKISLKALLDTGNTLRESKTEKGVLVVCWNALKKLFNTQKDFNEFMNENKETFISIPYKSVSGHFIMPGFLPDVIKVNGKEINVYVGISEVDFDDFYEAILPCDFDERNEKNE